MFTVIIFQIDEQVFQNILNWYIYVVPHFPSGTRGIRPTSGKLRAANWTSGAHGKSGTIWAKNCGTLYNWEGGGKWDTCHRWDNCDATYLRRPSLFCDNGSCRFGSILRSLKWLRLDFTRSLRIFCLVMLYIKILFCSLSIYTEKSSDWKRNIIVIIVHNYKTWIRV